MIRARALACAVVAMLAVTLAASVLAAVPATADYRPSPGGHFNLPRAGEKQYRIQSQISKAITHARKGSVIRISVFSWDRKILASQLVRAHRRGVQVQVLLNDHQVTPAQRILHRGLGRNPDRKNFAYECHNGCRSKGENLHSKFFLFSHTGNARDVVMTGSTNLTMNGAVNQYNDLWIKNESPKLYAQFTEFFQEMKLDRRQRPAYWHETIGDFDIHLTPYPNFGPNNDPLMSILHRVKCFGATGGTGNNGRAIVRVIMHTQNERRGVYIARKLRALYANGCDVKISYGYAGEKVRNVFRERTRRGFVPIHTTGYDTNGDGDIDLYTHQKELLISGHHGKDNSSRIVVTGSSNYNDDGLKGDEEIFVIKNRQGIYRQYIRNWNFVWENRSHLVRYIPYPSRAAAGSVGTSSPWAATAEVDFPSPTGSAWEND